MQVVAVQIVAGVDAKASLESGFGGGFECGQHLCLFGHAIGRRISLGVQLHTVSTDGFGRSDFRSKLREHFEINRHYIVVAALKALGEEGTVPVAKVAEAIKKYGINADKINPLYA